MHSTGLIPVEGHEGLYRDLKTGAIINTNKNEFQKYVSKRDEISRNQQQITQTAEEVKELKSEILELKQLLFKLIGDTNN